MLLFMLFMLLFMLNLKLDFSFLGFSFVLLSVDTVWIVFSFQKSENILFVFKKVSDNFFGSSFLSVTTFGTSVF